ncbi:MAG: hypothetical protein AB2809_13515 [Candidatus Thiodiazotropha sp.]
MNEEVKPDQVLSFHELVSDSATPPYFKLFSFQRRLSRVPVFLRSLLLGPFFYVVFYGMAMLLEGDIPDSALLVMAILSGGISSVLVLTTNSYQKSIEAVDHIASIMTSEEQIIELKDDFCNIFVRPSQSWFSLGFSIFITLAAFSMGFMLPDMIAFVLYLFLFVAIFIAGYMLWMSGAAIFWSWKLSRNGPYRLSHVPSKTVGIRKLSRLVGTYSLSFSLVICLGLLLFYTTPWANMVAYQYVESFIVYPFIAYTLIFILLPQIFIRKVIVDEKDKVLIGLENKMHNLDILESNFSKDLYQRYKNMNDFYNEILSTSDYALDFGTIGKFLSSLIFPITLTIMQQPEILDFLK